MASNKPFNLHHPIAYALIMATGMFLGYKMKSSLTQSDLPFGNKGTIGEIIELVNNKYVDKVNTDSTEIKAIDNLLAQLDPHSVYITPQDLKATNDDLQGSFEGIGIEYLMQKDTLYVSSVVSGGPSEAAGLQSGDKLIKVGDSIVAGKKLSNENITKKLRGPSGSKVKIQVLRSTLLKELSITRGEIPLYTIDAAYMLNTNVGYVKINRFGATTYTEFMKSIEALKKQGMAQLVIDVRDNPGGYLDAAVSIADEMIAGKGKIVYTRDKNKDMQTYNAQKNGALENTKLVVLIDEGSASAAEILSGSLQDYDRATLIGRRTFGKGLVQEQFGLSNGGAIRLTVARYYIPSGRCVQKDYSKGKNAYYNDVNDRYKNGELHISDSTYIIKDTSIYKTLGGKTVKGGGGISPDIFVPIKSASYSDDLYATLNTGLLTPIINDYFNENKTELTKNYTTVAHFIATFKVPDFMLPAFIANCKAEGVANTKLNSADIEFVNNRIKSNIAKQLFGKEALYQVINKDDEMIKIALQQLSK
jgi:carboxyl-terminal processing protease